MSATPFRQIVCSFLASYGMKGKGAPAMIDWTLIREFLNLRSEPDFAELLSRHVGLVHGVAMRELGDAKAAKDV